MTVILDPTAEQSPTIRPRLARPAKLDGLTIGILDIAKARGDVFLNRLAERAARAGPHREAICQADQHAAGAAAVAPADGQRGQCRHRRLVGLRLLHVVLYA